MKRKLADVEDDAEEEVVEEDAGRLHTLQCQAAGVILSHRTLLFRFFISSKRYSSPRATYHVYSNQSRFRLRHTLRRAPYR